MKNNYRRIKALLKMFPDIELFYVVDIRRYSNTLQAEYNPKLSLTILSLKFKSIGIDKNGFTCFQRSNITITLT